MIEKMLRYFAWFLMILFVIDLIFFGGILFVASANGTPIPFAIPIIFFSSLILVALKVKNYQAILNDSSLYIPQINACIFALAFILLYYSMWISMLILVFMLTLVFYMYAIALFVKTQRWKLACLSLILLMCAILMLPLVRIPGILMINAVANIAYFIYLITRYQRAKKLSPIKSNDDSVTRLKQKNITIVSFIHVFFAMIPLFLILISLIIALIQRDLSIADSMQYLIMLAFFPSIFYCGPFILIGIMLSLFVRTLPLILVALMSIVFWGGYWVLLYQYSAHLVLTNLQMCLLGMLYLLYLSSACWAFQKKSISH